MARTGGQAAGSRIGRTPPAVTLAGGTIATSSLLSDGSTDAVAIPVSPARAGDDSLVPGEGAAAAAARYGIDLAEIGDRASLTGAPGDVYVLQLPRPVGSAVVLPWAGLPPRLVLVGVGAGLPDDLRRAGAALARATRGLGRVVTTLGSEARQTASQAATAARAVAEGYLLAAYTPLRITSDPEVSAPGELVLLGRDGSRAGAAVGAARTSAAATWLVRDLASTPSNIKNPEWMAEQARRLGTHAGLEVVVRGPRELEEFGGILAVGRGSVSPPRLVTVAYRPRPQRRVRGKHVVIVGKGITYDTGGISIKPRDAMVPMKTDMSGAAVALATVLGAAASRCRPPRDRRPAAGRERTWAARRTGPVMCCTMFGGTTVEVANTDAEGRMVLADALAWADATLDPDVLIDVATLTGAASSGSASGTPRSTRPIGSSSRTWWRRVRPRASGPGACRWSRSTSEAVRLRGRGPAARAVDKSIGGGSITAALFLRRFVGTRTVGPPRHRRTRALDSDKHEVSKGATGYGARLLLRYLDALS